MKDSGVDPAALAKALSSSSSLASARHEADDLDTVVLSGAQRNDVRKGTSLVMPTQIGNYLRDPEIEDVSENSEDELGGYVPSGVASTAPVASGTEKSSILAPMSVSVAAATNPADADENSVVVLMENYKWDQEDADDDVPEEKGVWVDMNDVLPARQPAQKKGELSDGNSPFLADPELPSYPSERYNGSIFGSSSYIILYALIYNYE